MMQPKLHMSGLFAFAWSTFKARAGFLALLSLLLIVMVVAPLALSMIFQSTGLFITGFVLYIAAICVASTVFTYTMIELARGKELTLAEAFSSWRHTLNYMGVSIVYSMIVFAGLILFVIPGLVWSLKYMLAPYIVLGEDKGIGAALKESDDRTMGYKFDLAALTVLVTAFAYLAILPAYIIIALGAATSGALFASSMSSDLGSIVGFSSFAIIGLVLVAVVVWIVACITSLVQSKAYLELSK